MELNHDEDDPPVVDSWYDQYWGMLNRWAEQCLWVARLWGLY